MPAKIVEEGGIRVFDFFQMFPDEDAAREYPEEIRRGGDAGCPHCECERVIKLKRKRFTVLGQAVELTCPLGRFAADFLFASTTDALANATICRFCGCFCRR